MLQNKDGNQFKFFLSGHNILSMQKIATKNMGHSKNHQKIFQIQWISQQLDHLKIQEEKYIQDSGVKDSVGDLVNLFKRMELIMKELGRNPRWKAQEGKYLGMEICN